MFDLILSGGIIVTPRGRYNADIGVVNGQIATIAKDIAPKSGKRVLDLTNKHILPGCIDSHMHLWEPGFVSDHDFKTSTLASAAGGVTTIIEHPLSPPEVLNVEVLKEKIEIGERTSYVDFGLHGGVNPQYFSELPGLWEAGCTAFKIFMCFSGTEVPGLSTGELLEALQIIGSFGGTAIIHAESETILNYNKMKLELADRKDNLSFVEWRSPQAEAEAINRALFLLQETGARAVMLHTTVPEGVTMVNEARRKGLDIWVETCPHILYFTHTDLVERGPWITFSPPLRDKERVNKLWHQLRNGEIQLLGSDHGPVSPELKNGKDVWEGQPGLPGAETLVRMTLNAAANGWITLEQMTAMLAETPAQVYGLYPQKGTIRIGSDADFTIVDINKSSTIRASELKTSCGWTPYEGQSITGEITHSVLRGNIILQNGEVCGQPGIGHFIARRS